MPTITVPEDIHATLPDGTELTVSFGRDFIVRTLLANQAWGADMQEIFAAASIRGAFVDAKAGDTPAIAKDHLQKLQERMRKPSVPYNPTTAVFLLPFFDAVLNAKD